MLFKFGLSILLCFSEILAKDFYSKDISTNDKSGKLRICIVENRGSFRRTEKYCPIIEKQTNIECIIGVDRLDCARRISKGYAHFGVFSSEDLVGARWAALEILVTSEIRFHPAEFEYEVVVVVDNEAKIYSAVDLKKSRVCFPGYQLDNWNDIIGDYLESTMVVRQCESELTLTESRIKASANYFAESCKAGPWVSDPEQDRALKQKYPSLCELCYDQARCGVGDKHWGRKGPLYCLTGGNGQAAYVRLDDVRSFFGLTGLSPEADINNYSFLCPDSHLQPINTTRPCTWISKPWSVLAAKRTHAEKVHGLFQDLDVSVDSDQNWQQALLMLLESYHVNVTSLDTPIPIDDYLDKSSGYQSAHSFPACYPPRQIVYCTYTLIDFVKCSWLQEVSTVYKIEPNIQCIRGESLYRCLDDVNKDVADVVLVDQNARIKSENEFNLTSLLYEYSSEFSKNYVTIAVVKASSNIKTFEELRDKTACFPSHEGASFYSVSEHFQKSKLIESSCSKSVENFFSSRSCFGADNCHKNYGGDKGAFECLKDFGDVAFMNMETFQNLTPANQRDYRVLCPSENSDSRLFKRSSDPCYLSWTSHGTLLINKSKNQLRRNEIINTLKSMDVHFGKYKFKSGNIPFTLFGKFDDKTDVLFKDSTDNFLTNYEIIHKSKFERNLEDFYERLQRKPPQCSMANYLNANSAVILIVTILFVRYLS